VLFGEIVKPTGQPADSAALLQAVQRDADRLRAAKVEKCLGRETRTSPVSLDSVAYVFLNRVNGGRP